MRNGIILLVEDSPDDEALTLRAMKRNNILNDVVVARDGAEALDYLFRIGPYASRPEEPLPEVILLDLNLPKMSGLEVLQAIRANPLTKLTPVIILTTSNEDRDRLGSYELGANSYIQKPVDFNRFSEVIRQLGIYWLLVNTGPAGGR